MFDPWEGLPFQLPKRGLSQCRDLGGTTRGGTFLGPPARPLKALRSRGVGSESDITGGGGGACDEGVVVAGDEGRWVGVLALPERIGLPRRGKFSGICLGVTEEGLGSGIKPGDVGVKTHRLTCRFGC